MINVDIDRAVFNPVYLPYLDRMSRTQVLFGGSSSGKSVFLAQRAIYDVLRGGRNYLIVRQVGTTLRGSVYTEVKKVITEWGLLSLFTVNKTEKVITCANGYQILFGGLDDVEKLKSLVPEKGAITDIWVEEATETQREDVKQLYKRQRGGSDAIPKRLTLSFNPILQSHWIFDDYFKPLGWADAQTEHQDENLSILKTWYIHNRFLTPDDIRDLENETDEYFKNVYTFGNWGVLGDAIFTNWIIEDLSGMHAQFTNRRHGLDFGFASDPAAMPLTHYDRPRKHIYIFDELYERGLTNPMLAQEIKQKIGLWHENPETKKQECYATEAVTCDSSEPKSILELQQCGVNALSAKKGKDSVNYGIQWLKQQTIVVDKRCIHTQNEFRQYHWRKDKDGNSLRQPVDKNNHIIDGLRYGYEDESLSSWVML